MFIFEFFFFFFNFITVKKNDPISGSNSTLYTGNVITSHIRPTLWLHLAVVIVDCDLERLILVRPVPGEQEEQKHQDLVL
jgi:hypothetical protein